MCVYVFKRLQRYTFLLDLRYPKHIKKLKDYCYSPFYHIK